MDFINKMDRQAFEKIAKHHFFKDIQISFYWGTGIGLKCTQFFSFLKISTNTAARGAPNFGPNGLWRAGCLSNGLNFYVNLAHTYDEEMLKISA